MISTFLGLRVLDEASDVEMLLLIGIGLERIGAPSRGSIFIADRRRARARGGGSHVMDGLVRCSAVGVRDVCKMCTRFYGDLEAVGQAAGLKKTVLVFLKGARRGLKGLDETRHIELDEKRYSRLY